MYALIKFLVNERESCRAWFSYAAGKARDTFTSYVNIHRRIIICPRHSPPVCRRSWAEFNFAGRRLAPVGDCRHWMKCFIWVSSGSSEDATYDVTTSFFPHNSIFYKWLHQFDLHFALIWVHRWWSIADASGTYWNRSSNVVTCNRRLRRR